MVFTSHRIGIVSHNISIVSGSRNPTSRHLMDRSGFCFSHVYTTRRGGVILKLIHVVWRSEKNTSEGEKKSDFLPSHKEKSFTSGNTGSPAQCWAVKEAEEGIDVAGSPRMDARCKELPQLSEWSPRTDTNDQNLVSPGLTFRIINVGTRIATHSRTSTPTVRVSIVRPATRVTRFTIFDRAGGNHFYDRHRSFVFQETEISILCTECLFILISININNLITELGSIGV